MERDVVEIIRGCESDVSNDIFSVLAKLASSDYRRYLTLEKASVGELFWRTFLTTSVKLLEAELKFSSRPIVLGLKLVKWTAGFWRSDDPVDGGTSRHDNVVSAEAKPVEVEVARESSDEVENVGSFQATIPSVYCQFL